MEYLINQFNNNIINKKKYYINFKIINIFKKFIN